MSVRVGDRSEGTLSVLNDIRILGEYTIQICKSEKVFPKSSRWIMAKPIVDECISALTCVRRANAVFVQTRYDYEYRRNQQVQAHSHLDATFYQRQRMTHYYYELKGGLGYGNSKQRTDQTCEDGSHLQSTQRRDGRCDA